MPRWDISSARLRPRPTRTTREAISRNPRIGPHGGAIGRPAALSSLPRRVIGVTKTAIASHGCRTQDRPAISCDRRRLANLLIRFPTFVDGVGSASKPLSPRLVQGSQGSGPGPGQSQIRYDLHQNDDCAPRDRSPRSLRTRAGQYPVVRITTAIVLYRM